MGNVVTIRAESIEEAILKASKALKVPREEIQYEVIDVGYSGKFRKSPIIIQASVMKASQNIAKPEESIDIPSSSLSVPMGQARNGTVWVKDGKIYCRNGSYQYALLTPCKNLTLFVNDQVVTNTTVVTEEDVIDYEIQDEWMESKLSLVVSEDKMQVLLEIIPGYSITRYLKDQPPSRELILELVETKTVKMGVSEEMVYEELRKLGVQMEMIIHDEIRRACRSEEPVQCVVARGIAPIPGQDGVFEFFSQIRQEEQEQITVSDLVDWKERSNLPSVKAGEVIGVPVPAKPGVNGWNVFGEEVPAKEVKELTILPGEGITLYGADQKVVATASGRVKITERPNNTLKFEILPQYVHNGNVNLQTGNIRFHGDVYILGDVEAGMVVEAGGDLRIFGRVTHASIRAGGDVIVEFAVVGSVITCGYLNLIWGTLLPHFKAIYESLVQLIDAVAQVESSRSFSRREIAKMGLQPLLKLLTEVKFKELPSHIRKASSIIKNNKEIFDVEIHRVVDFLEKAFLYYHPSISTLEQLRLISTYIESTLVAAEFDSNKKTNVKVHSLTNSKILSAWDVEVERFSYGSDIQAKGKVQVNEELRGGQIKAGNFVKAKEIGSKGGSHTTVWVTGEKGYVQANFIWPDTTIRIANLTKKIINEHSSVIVRINDRGGLDLRYRSSSHE